MKHQILTAILLALLSLATAAAAIEQDTPHGVISLACNACHTTAGWVPVEQTPGFNHQQTSFPLEGRHETVNCRGCHVSLVFAEAGSQCRDCHLDIHRGQFAQSACDECHTPAKWNNEEEMLSRHQQTRFPLVGVHAALDCQGCHASGQFAGSAVDCQSCHFADYAATQNPAHASMGMPVNCTQCHSFTKAAWKISDFNHASAAALACVGCHEENYESAANPNHAAGAFSLECAGCHATTAWRPASFDHNQTAFPLTNAHSVVACTECHIGGNYNNIAADCYNCHQTVFDGSDNPPHLAGNYNHECTVCHTTITWAPAEFDHNLSAFQLTGAHIAANCALCHTTGQYPGTPTDCWSCHEVAYRESDNPDHEAGQFSQSCEECHVTAAWSPATFDHNATAFPLRGAHLAANCQACHVNGQFPGTPTTCFACHETEFNTVTDPNHVTGGFDHNCALCHGDAAWLPATFDHATTDYPLTGAHAATSCVQCHANGQYNGTPTACFACHEQNFIDANDPDHEQSQFSHVCSDCHGTSAWSPATFDHNQSDFPLTGAHLSTSCVQCHVNGQYSGTPTACFSCHEQDFNNVDDPNHVVNQFSHICTECHSTAGWDPATFNHNQTDFPLTGAHIAAACNECHANGQYAGTPTACFFCHETDYNQTNDPNHAGAGFPTTCLECHTTSNWNSTFNHQQYFPIDNGSHQGEWDACSDCHTNAANYAIFSCITCHEHNRTDMDDEHDEVGNYVYESSACLNCHPNGEAEDRVFQPRNSRQEKR